ncbi:ribosomal L1 domain-containing protein 1 [Octodon degus]|uniref:Ribosomal L1 domain-containing protein 1 n=1 Tax=Octodon degus TaxID=10160 RepID=A0A6P3VDW0_OCTDE|nr:ribosomal L1 domain-containing protein 1 [Octodon degus]
MDDPSSSQESGLPATLTPAERPSPAQLDKEQVRKAVEALLTHSKSRKNKNGLLLNENENLFLMVVLWKIPGKELRVRLSLPHGIRSDLSEICLFTKDELQSTEQTERFYRKLLNKHGIKTISRFFYTAVLNFSAVRIGHTGMQAQDITENIVAVAESLSKKLPEKWESVKLLFVKTGKSVSLPIFSSFVSYRNDANKMVIRKLKENKKKTGKVKAQVKVTNESDEEIPQLVPIGVTPVKENVEEL